MRKTTGVLLALVAAMTMNAQDFIFNNASEPQSLDPALIQGVPEHRLFMALFEGLLVFNPKTGGAEPGLAEKWTISKDLTTYTFKLRKANWSDGTPITAKQFVDSWLRILDPATASNYSYMVADAVAGAKEYNSGKGPKEGVKIKAVDDRTFEVTFVGPLPYALDMLTHYAFAVVPTQAVAKFGKDWIKPGNFVGNGPFILKEWKPQDHILTVKNDKYWDAKNVKLKSITFLPIEDQSVAYDKFKAGEVDWLPEVPPAKIDEIKLRKDYQHGTGSTVYYYIFNVTRKPFDDVRVRKAFSMAINRKELCDQVLKAGDVASAGLVPPFGSYKTAKGNVFNPEEAKKLLASAGYPGGKGFPKFTLIYNTSARHKRISEWVQQQWKTILGIDADLTNLEWNTFLDTRSKTHDFSVTRAGWQADYMDPGNYLDMFKTGAGNNDGLFSNKTYDELLNKAAKIPGGPARDKIMMQAEEILVTKEQGVTPFFFYVNQDMINTTKWGGWYVNTINVHPWKPIYKK